MLLANEETYRNLSAFKSKEELNEAVRAHRRANKLNKTELAVLDLLSQYSCNDKHFGVSYCAKNTIAKTIGKSRRTIIRVCQRLESLGIIRQVECYRKSDGQQTSNAVVILPAEAADQENVTQEPAENVTPRHSNSLNSNTVIYNTYSSNDFVNKIKSPYQRFKETAQAMMGTNDNKLVNRIYGVYLAKLKRSALGETKVLTIALHALKAVAQASKRKNIENLAGFFSNTMKNMIARLTAIETETTEYTRVEYVPEWINEEYVPSEPSAEADERRRRLQERIAKRKKC